MPVRLELGSSAVDVLGQLFVSGPVWDGNVSSKAGRDALVRAGLASRWNGWNFLTTEGVMAASEWTIAKDRTDQRWWDKIRKGG